MENIGLYLFLAQQLGMTLGVGASTFALLFFLSALKDGKMEPTERRFLHIVYATLRVGLLFIILSGALITWAHVLAGERGIVLEPAYAFKWLLIIAILLNGFLMTVRLMPALIGGPLAGATWYALFFLHNTAPETDWVTLGVLYGIWTVIFILLFHIIRLLTKGHSDGNEPVAVKERVAPTYPRPAGAAPAPVSLSPRPIPSPLSAQSPRAATPSPIPAQPAPVTVASPRPAPLPDVRPTPSVAPMSVPAAVAPRPTPTPAAPMPKPDATPVSQVQSSAPTPVQSQDPVRTSPASLPPIRPLKPIPASTPATPATIPVTTMMPKPASASSVNVNA